MIRGVSYSCGVRPLSSQIGLCNLLLSLGVSKNIQSAAIVPVVLMSHMLLLLLMQTSLGLSSGLAGQPGASLAPWGVQVAWSCGHACHGCALPYQ